MVKVLIDSNIMMDMRNDIDEAYDELDHYNDRAISVITWMEVVVGLDAAALLQFEAALIAAGIEVIHTNSTIARLARQWTVTPFGPAHRICRCGYAWPLTRWHSRCQRRSQILRARDQMLAFPNAGSFSSSLSSVAR